MNKKSLSIIALSLIAIVLIWAAPDFNESTAAGVAQEKLLTVQVEIKSAGAAEPKVIVTAELTKTEQEQKMGLMFRKTMAENEGMLFVYDTPQVLTMWMKNTLLPLDMVFVGEQGTIVKIEEHTVPRTLTVLSSDVPAVAVLELNAGTAKAKDLQIGDYVSYPH